MKKRVGHKIGDTLVEVTLAIGIFSMVGVAVVAVVSGSSSSAQSALEVTVTREVLDEQAEALRYIHSSYIAEGRSNELGNEKYQDIWNKIISNAIEIDSDANKKIINDFNSTRTCEAVMNGSYLDSINAFVIDPRSLYLGDYAAPLDTGRSWQAVKTGALKKIVTTEDDDDVTFAPAVTVPRILYGDEGDNPSIYAMGGAGDRIMRVEGVFVMAVKDTAGTTIVSDDAGATVLKRSAYYDFYIRSCWFGPGADRPSTISTVIRLYEPAINYDLGF